MVMLQFLLLVILFMLYCGLDAAAERRDAGRMSFNCQRFVKRGNNITAMSATENELITGKRRFCLQFLFAYDFVLMSAPCFS